MSNVVVRVNVMTPSTPPPSYIVFERPASIGARASFNVPLAIESKPSIEGKPPSRLSDARLMALSRCMGSMGKPNSLLMRLSFRVQNGLPVDQSLGQLRRVEINDSFIKNLQNPAFLLHQRKVITSHCTRSICQI